MGGENPNFLNDAHSYELPTLCMRTATANGGVT